MRESQNLANRMGMVHEDFLMRDYGITDMQLKDLDQMHKLLGDPRIRVEVAPTTECHASMMAMLEGNQV